MADRDDRQAALDDVIDDTREAVRESAELMREDRADYEYSEFSNRPMHKAEIADRRDWRQKIEMADRHELKALDYNSRMNDVRTAARQVAAKHRDAHFMEDLERQAQAAKTTVPTAMRSYVDMEKQLRADPVQGILAISHRLGIDPGQLSQALQPYQQAPPAYAQKDTREAAAYQEATTVAGEAERAIPDYKALEPYIVDVLRHPQFQQHRTGDFRRDLSTAIHYARIAHSKNREHAQTQKQKRATRSVSGGHGHDAEYEPRRKSTGDRLDPLRDSVRQAMRELD